MRASLPWTTRSFEIPGRRFVRYLLDTNVISQLVRNPGGPVAQRLLEVGPERAGISIVVACEIRFGVAKRYSKKLAERLERVLEELEILPLEPPVDQHYGDIRSFLERSGTHLGPNDLLIAAHARALALTMVTENVREFERVPGLRVESWRS